MTAAGEGFEPRLAVASLSGESDAAWAERASPHVGAAFLGGIALDAASRAAARDLVARGRSEFLPPEPVRFVADQLDALADVPVRAAVNVRSATLDPVGEAASVCAELGAVCEINAHCRQPELRAVGCGETLLADTDRLAAYVERAAATGATVSVKVRAEVPGVDLAATARAVADAGADWIHVDAMDTESAVADVAAAAGDDLFVVANNGVRGPREVGEYMEYGADAVSAGRPSDDPRVLRRVRRAVADWRAQHEPRGRDGPESGGGVAP